MRRKKEKEIEQKRTLSEKIRDQKKREQQLFETKMRYESNNEEFKKKLSEKLEKINKRV
jgi:hypothetical protein